MSQLSFLLVCIASAPQCMQAKGGQFTLRPERRPLPLTVPNTLRETCATRLAITLVLIAAATTRLLLLLVGSQLQVTHAVPSPPRNPNHHNCVGYHLLLLLPCCWHPATIAFCVSLHATRVVLLLSVSTQPQKKPKTKFVGSYLESMLQIFTLQHVNVSPRSNREPWLL